MTDAHRFARLVAEAADPTAGPLARLELIDAATLAPAGAGPLGWDAHWFSIGFLTARSEGWDRLPAGEWEELSPALRDHLDAWLGRESLADRLAAVGVC